VCCRLSFVGLFVSNFVQKLLNGFARNFQAKLATCQCTNDEILVAIRTGDPDTDAYRVNGKTCLGGDMHFPSAYSGLMIIELRGKICALEQ